MFDELIIWYLFLGGAGGGTYLLYAFVRLVAWRRGGAWRLLAETVSLPALVLSCGLLMVGAVCLLKDLARPSEALALFAKPTWSAISVGTWALGALLICLVVLIAMRCYRRGRSFSHAWAVEAAAAVFALVVVAYTGMLLYGIAAVPLWSSSFLPTLFVLSSLSSGVAVLLMVASFMMPSLKAVERQLGVLLRMDAVVIICELLVIVLLYLQLQDNPAAALSFSALATGSLCYAFWGGFVACGLIAPLVMEVFSSFVLKGGMAWYIIAGSLILIGAFFLRFCAIDAGVHLSLFMFAGL